LRKRSSALGVGALVLGLLIAGCGSDGGSGGGQASAQQVDAACKANNKRTASEIRKAYSAAKANGLLGSERDEIKLEVSVLVPMLIAEAESQVTAISSLEVPEEDAAQVKQILGAYQTWIEKAEGTPFKVVVANDVYNQAREKAGEYGLEQCGVNPFEVFASS
jgi:hypothetical protein